MDVPPVAHETPVSKQTGSSGLVQQPPKIEGRNSCRTRLLVSGAVSWHPHARTCTLGF